MILYKTLFDGWEKTDQLLQYSPTLEERREPISLAEQLAVGSVKASSEFLAPSSNCDHRCLILLCRTVESAYNPCHEHIHTCNAHDPPDPQCGRLLPTA